MKSRIPIAAVLLAATAAVAHAKFARTWEPVPTNRLLANVGNYVTVHPDDAQGHYTLGRIHALIYSAGVQPPSDLEVVAKNRETGKPAPLPGFPPFSTIRVSPPAMAGKLPESLRAHLVASLCEYRRAVAMAPKEPLYLLGYGWMLQQGAAHAAELSDVARDASMAPTAKAFEQRALDVYRRAYRAVVTQELDSTGRSGIAADSSIATEAGEGILSLLGKRKHRTGAERDEMSQVQSHLREISKKPQYITPVVLSIGRASRLGDLLSADTARFDLAASGREEMWPWVKPGTGILVWDPERSGRIVSGRQIFGSRTWQMMWRNGYEALAALDDNADGRLDGRELAGIAVWFDRNGNGRSDPGEVAPAASLGIAGIAVRPDGIRDNVPWIEAGITLTDGRRLPTWDWTPASLPEPSPSGSLPATWN